MKLTNDILHNPFKNRFHYPVTWRLDEMQAHSNVVWLRSHVRGESDPRASRSGAKASTYRDRAESDYGDQSKPDGQMFASAFALFIVLIASLIVLFQS